MFPLLWEDGGQPTGEYYRVVPTNLSSEEEMQYLAHRQTELLRTIKSGVVFFAVLAVISP